MKDSLGLRVGNMKIRCRVDKNVLKMVGKMGGKMGAVSGDK